MLQLSRGNRRRRALILIIVLVTGGAASGRLLAQQEEGPVRRPRVAGTHFIFGGVALGLGQLNAAFAGAGYPTLPERVWTTGAGGYLVFGRLVLGGSGQRVLPRTRTLGGFKNQLSGGYGLFDIGVTLIGRNRTKLFPVVGVGAGRVVSKLTQTAGFPFDTALANPLRGTELHAHTWLFHAGMDLDQVIRARGQIALGLSAGYIFRSGGTTWSSDRNPVSGGPDAAFKGAYLRMSIGVALGTRWGAIAPSIAPTLPYLIE